MIDDYASNPQATLLDTGGAPPVPPSPGHGPVPRRGGSHSANWERKLAEWIEFRRANVNSCGNGPSVPSESLKGWLDRQRFAARAGKLSADRSKRLAEAGFDLHSQHDKVWDEQRAALAEFHRQFGHCQVPKTPPQYRKLAQWLHSQRSRDRAGKLSADRRKRLAEAGFDFRSRQDKVWDEQYAALAEFHRQFGHYQMPKTLPQYQKLAQWLSSQRSRDRAGTLAPERASRLRSLGAVLPSAVSAENAAASGTRAVPAWKEMFRRLALFKKSFGHCRVPAEWREDLPLAAWLEQQLQQAERGLLFFSQFRWLCKLGVRFPQPDAAHDEAMFAALEDFHRRVGHCDVAAESPVNMRLVAWLRSKRLFASEQLLAPEQIARFARLGLRFTSDERVRMEEKLRQKWNHNYSQLEQFQATHGHLRVPGKEGNLLPWLHHQCSLARRQRLRPEDRERLVRLGVPGLDALLKRPSREERNRRQAERRAAYWDRMFATLEDFKRRFGHCCVPANEEGGFRPLYMWLVVQRAEARGRALPVALRQRLADLGVTFERVKPRGTPRPARWEWRLAQLMEYKKRFGHADVPISWPENPPLGLWLGRQRTLARNGTLMPERLRRLLEMGFTWQVQHHSQQALSAQNGLPFGQAIAPANVP